MTQPGDLPPLFDTGNTLLQTDVPAAMLTGKVPVPDGERGVVTIRTTSATLTVTLTKADAEQWAASFADLAASLSGAGLVVPSRGQAVQIADAARRNANGGPPQRPGGQ